MSGRCSASQCPTAGGLLPSSDRGRPGLPARPRDAQVSLQMNRPRQAQRVAPSEGVALMARQTPALECTGGSKYASTSEPAGQTEVHAVGHSRRRALRRAPAVPVPELVQDRSSSEPLVAPSASGTNIGGVTLPGYDLEMGAALQALPLAVQALALERVDPRFNRHGSLAPATSWTRLTPRPRPCGRIQPKTRDRHPQPLRSRTYVRSPS